MDKAKTLMADMPSVTVSKFDISTSCECGGDYTMPEYYPAIRKIVSCTAEALPDTKFLSGNLLEYGGNIAFTILYIGEDGALVSVPYTCEYSGNHPLPAEVRGTAEISLDAKAEDVQCRVLAPRKFSARSKIRLRLCANDYAACGLEVYEQDGSVVDPGQQTAIQKLRSDIPTMKSGRGATTGTVSGEFNEKSGTKPISCSASINVTEVKCRKNAIWVRGEAVLKCLMFTAEGVYAPMRTRFPFEEVINAEGASEGDMCRAWGRAAAVSVTEDAGLFKTEIEYDLDAEWCRKGSVTILDDAYCVGQISEVQRSEWMSKSPICCKIASLSINGNGKRTTKPENGEYMVDLICAANVEKTEQIAEKVVFTGNCLFKAYIASNGEVICEEFSLPLKYETDACIGSCEGNISLSGNISVIDCRGKLEGDTITANAELRLSLCAVRETKIAPVTKLVLDKSEKDEEENPYIKVFYADGKERLWDISKRYLAPISQIEKINGISRKETAEGRPILIPCGLS